MIEFGTAASAAARVESLLNGRFTISSSEQKRRSKPNLAKAQTKYKRSASRKRANNKSPSKKNTP